MNKSNCAVAIAASLLASGSSALAAPPVPLAVNVTNPVLPVEISNAQAISVDVASSTTEPSEFLALASEIFLDGGIQAQDFGQQISQSAELTNIHLYMTATPNPAGGFCTMTHLTLEANGVERTVARLTVFPGQNGTLSIPLPNIQVPAGAVLKGRVVTSATSCLLNFVTHGKITSGT